jgi:hypothetical protein
MSESELTVRHLNMARFWLMRNGSVLFYGSPATVDGSAVKTLIHGADGRRVLSCHRGDTDPDRPLFALTGLLSSVNETDVAWLPPAHRKVLGDLIFRHPSAAGPAPSVRALGPAVLSLLRALTRSGPLLLVLDAVHRLDRETRAVLTFVAERVDELPIHMVAVEEVTDSATPEGHPLCPPPLVMIRLSSGLALADADLAKACRGSESH